MKVVIENVGDFKKSLEAVGSIVDECVLTLQNNSINIKAIDPSQIAMVLMKYQEKSFTTLQLSEPINLGINLKHLNKILKRVKSGEIITFENSDNKLKMTIAGRYQRTFEIPLIDFSSSNQPNEPKIDFTATATVQANVLKEAIKDLSIISKKVDFEINSNKVILSSFSDKGDGKVEISEDMGLTGISVNDIASARFNLDYLKSFLKPIPSDSLLTISLKTDSPVKIEAPFVNAYVTYYLAPIIRDEE